MRRLHRFLSAISFFCLISLGFFAKPSLALELVDTKINENSSGLNVKSANESTTIISPTKISELGVIDGGMGKQNLSSFVGGCGEGISDESGAVVGQASIGTACEISLFFLRMMVGSQPTDGNNLGAYRLNSPGAIPVTSGLISKMYETPIASTGEFVADVLNDLRHPLGAKPVYAQGLGFSSLSPVLSLWKIFRNLAYFFFVLIFVFTGFLIMFRSKIGSQAAVTVQQALPKLVVSLILVSFSYAIAGLLIDGMYLVIYLIINIFSDRSILGDSLKITGGIFSGDTPLSDIAFRYNIVQNTFSFITNGVVGNIAGAIGQIATSSLGLNPSDLGAAGLQGIANILVTLVLAIAIIVNVFRVFFALLQAYFNIFLGVISGPIVLLLGALPGKNTFSDWVKGLVENLMVFPVIIFMIFLAYYFSTGFVRPGESSGFSAPQLSSNQGSGLSVYRSLLALAVLMAMPEVLKITKGLMKGQLDVNMGDLQKNAMNGVPLGARLALGGGIGLAEGGLNGARTLLRERKNPQRFDLARTEFNKAFMGGAGRGVKHASTLSTALNANQPDILNPITQAIDKKYSPETARKEDVRQQNEDIIDLLKQINAKP